MGNDSMVPLFTEIMMAEELPRQELLLKMLNMTTSDNDGQALVALRKANALLASAGWSWEKLILGKIVVVADPFNSIKAPPKQEYATSTPRPPPPPPRPMYSSPPPPPPRPTPARGNPPLSILPNKYAGWCYCCGNHVPHDAGMVFNPSRFNPRATDKWMIACVPCNKAGNVQPSPARRNIPVHASINPDLNIL